MFAVGGEVAALVRTYGIQFVHFVFGEAAGAELMDAKTKTEDDEENEAADYRPVERADKTQPLNSPGLVRLDINQRGRRTKFQVTSHARLPYQQPCPTVC